MSAGAVDWTELVHVGTVQALGATLEVGLFRDAAEQSVTIAARSDSLLVECDLTHAQVDELIRLLKAARMA